MSRKASKDALLEMELPLSGLSQKIIAYYETLYLDMCGKNDYPNITYAR
jgi:hypothetical protein